MNLEFYRILARLREERIYSEMAKNRKRFYAGLTPPGSVSPCQVLSLKPQNVLTPAELSRSSSPFFRIVGPFRTFSDAALRVSAENKLSAYQQ